MGLKFRPTVSLTLVSDWRAIIVSFLWKAHMGYRPCGTLEASKDEILDKGVKRAGRYLPALFQFPQDDYCWDNS
jgi:hypothetical protein